MNTTPGVAGLIVEVTKHPAGRPALEMRYLCLDAGTEARVEQTLILGKAKDENDLLVFTRRHDGVAAETRVAANIDPCIRPTGTDLLDDAFKFLDAAGGGIDIRWAQPGTQQVLTTEEVQRQVAATAKVAMENAPLLVAVERVVRGVQV